MRSFLTIGFVAAAMAVAATPNAQAPPQSGGAMMLSAADMQQLAAA